MIELLIYANQLALHLNYHKFTRSANSTIFSNYSAPLSTTRFVGVSFLFSIFLTIICEKPLILKNWGEVLGQWSSYCLWNSSTRSPHQTWCTSCGTSYQVQWVQSCCSSESLTPELTFIGTDALHLNWGVSLPIYIGYKEIHSADKTMLLVKRESDSHFV